MYKLFSDDLDDEVDRNDLKELKRLLAAGADVNAAYLDGMTCLMYTAREGNYQATKLMIVNNASVNIKTKDNNTALTMACYPARTLNIEIVRLLLENGADVNNPGNKGKTCLMSKVMNSEAAQLLIGYKADVKIKDDNGMTALHYASDNGKIEVVGLLLENGADPDIQDNYGESPLFKAVLKNELKIEKLLLEKGASPLDKDDEQKLTNKKLLQVCLPRSATHVTVDLKELQRLLAAGADSNYRSDRSDTKNITCLMRMAKKGDVEATKLLMKNKADPNIKDSYGWTALHQAVYYDHIKIVGLLLDNGADPDIKSDIIGWTSLFITAVYGRTKMQEILLKHGASPLDENEKLELNNRKLWAICMVSPKDELLSKMLLHKNGVNYDDEVRRLDHEELERLLAAGADINYKDIEYNQTCLMRISRNGGVEDVKKVLESKPDVNMQDYNGWTALHQATFTGNIEVIRLLLDNGADPDIKDNNGRTALQKTKNNEVEKLLEAAKTTDNDDDDDAVDYVIVT